MKKIIILAVSAFLMLSACTKEPIPILEQTTWQYSTEISNIRYTFILCLSSPTHGYAVVYEESNNVSNTFMEHIYDVKYTFDGEEAGTMTFRKEYGEIINSYHSDINNYTDTITTSFYTYAGNNKMLIHDTPNKLIRQIELTRQSYSLTNQ